MKKIIYLILKKRLYNFIKKYSINLEESIKNCNNLLELRIIIIDNLFWLINIYSNETIHFIIKNKSLLKYLNIYVNKNNPTEDILIINNIKKLIISTNKKCFIINSKNVDVTKANETAIFYSQDININNSYCEIIKYSSNIKLTECEIRIIKNSETINTLECTLNFISSSDLIAEFCEKGRCHHNTNIKAICCKDIILFDTSSAQVFGNTNIECYEYSYCDINDDAIVTLNDYSYGNIYKGKSVTFNNCSHGIIKNIIKTIPDITLNDNSMLYSYDVKTDPNKVKINDNSLFKKRDINFIRMYLK